MPPPSGTPLYAIPTWPRQNIQNPVMQQPQRSSVQQLYQPVTPRSQHSISQRPEPQLGETRQQLWNEVPSLLSEREYTAPRSPGQNEKYMDPRVTAPLPSTSKNGGPLIGMNDDYDFHHLLSLYKDCISNRSLDREDIFDFVGLVRFYEYHINEHLLSEYEKNNFLALLKLYRKTLYDFRVDLSNGSLPRNHPQSNDVEYLYLERLYKDCLKRGTLTLKSNNFDFQGLLSIYKICLKEDIRLDSGERGFLQLLILYQSALHNDVRTFLLPKESDVDSNDYKYAKDQDFNRNKSTKPVPVRIQEPNRESIIASKKDGNLRDKMKVYIPKAMKCLAKEFGKQLVQELVKSLFKRN